MAKNPNRRIPPAQLQGDKDAFDALKAISNYAPANPAYSVEAITQVRQNMDAKQAVETQASAAYDAARDDATSSEWDFHGAILGVKDQVAAQFGKNSNEYQSLGLKKPSEYQRTGARQSRKPASAK